MRARWLLGSIAVACAPRAASPPPAAPEAEGPPSLPATAGTSAPSSAPVASTATEGRWQIAVLPIDEDELFRDERRGLREKLAAALARRLPAHQVLPLAEVDQKLAPVGKQGGRCAWEHEPLAQRARSQGWHTTEILHVGGLSDSAPELWLNLNQHGGLAMTLVAPFDERLPLLSRYERAFAALSEKPNAGLLGGLAGTFRPKGEVRAGALTLCQRKGFHDCRPSTRGFADQAAAFAQCFAGADDERAVLLFEGDKRCEIENLHDPSGADGKREACLCAALRRSAGARATSERDKLVIDFEAAEIAGKPRPEVRVIEASTNLRAAVDWHRQGDRPVHRLSLDHLDGLQAPLARCALTAGKPTVAELSLGETGRVEQAHVIGGAEPKATVACIEGALRRGAFACTNDGRPARLRLAIWKP